MSRIKIVFLLIFIAISIEAKKIEFSSIFEKYKIDGTIIISTLTNKNYIYNLKRSKERFSPASTFKILNTLISLQEKAIKDEKEIIKWDKKIRNFDAWNQDQSIESAFPISCVWFYQELAKRIGEQKYSSYLKKLKYGNQLVDSNITNFWLDGVLKISAQEQINFLKNLYLNRVPFDRKYIDTLKEVMLIEKSPKYKLYAKTGWAFKSKIGWYVGYLETKENIYFFAMNIDMKEIDSAKYRKILTIEALKKIIPNIFE